MKKKLKNILSNGFSILMYGLLNFVMVLTLTLVIKLDRQNTRCISFNKI